MTPIFKKDDPSVVSNYRLISLLSAVGKVLEKVVHKHLFNYIRDHEILSALQLGFIPGDSTVNQLVDIYNNFVNPLTKAKKSVLCFVTEYGTKAFSLNLSILMFRFPIIMVQELFS